MRVIYIDSDFRCHVTDDGTMTAVTTDVFDNKCQTYIEGHRFVPSGYTWTREDGIVFDGEMITCWKPSIELDEVQREYEHEQYLAFLEEKASYTEAYNEGVNEA